MSDEEDALNNIPDNLQDSDRYGKIEDSIGYLTEAAELIDKAIDAIEDAMA